MRKSHIPPLMTNDQLAEHIRSHVLALRGEMGRRADEINDRLYQIEKRLERLEKALERRAGEDAA